MGEVTRRHNILNIIVLLLRYFYFLLDQHTIICLLFCNYRLLSPNRKIQSR